MLGTNFATTDSVPAGRNGGAGEALSSIAAERMACHVPPREPLRKRALGKIFEEEVAETPNLQGKCALVWQTYHVSDDPEG